MKTMEISNYLEKIRYGRKMTQEEFIDGVVSMRQYQRYRSGECEITYEKVEQFANKLGIPIKKLLYEFELDKNKQYITINSLYNAVVNKDIELVKELKSKLLKQYLYGEEMEMYYHHALLIDDYYNKKISSHDLIFKTKELIGYPLIIKQKYFTEIEVLILSFLIEYLNEKEQETLLNKITNILDDEEAIIGSDSEIIYSLLIMRLSKIYGIQKNYPMVMHLCDKGIDKGISNRNLYLLDYFFYYKALAHFCLEEYDKYEDTLFRCYNAIQVEGNTSKIDKFTKLIEEDFGIVFDAFVIKYIQKFSK